MGNSRIYQRKLPDFPAAAQSWPIWAGVACNTQHGGGVSRCDAGQITGGRQAGHAGAGSAPKTSLQGARTMRKPPLLALHHWTSPPK
eukprot:scaffold564_cov248-Pinguiococcus_pyrenoidosus.AAC.8